MMSGLFYFLSLRAVMLSGVEVIVEKETILLLSTTFLSATKV